MIEKLIVNNSNPNQELNEVFIKKIDEIIDLVNEQEKKLDTATATC